MSVVINALRRCCVVLAVVPCWTSTVVSLPYIAWLCGDGGGLLWCGCTGQSWEEKERLSMLYEEERKKNLANPTKIRSVMQVGVDGWVDLP